MQIKLQQLVLYVDSDKPLDKDESKKLQQALSQHLKYTCPEARKK